MSMTGVAEGGTGEWNGDIERGSLWNHEDKAAKNEEEKKSVESEEEEESLDLYIVFSVK